MRRLKILTWHIHGSYLNTLGYLDHDWFLPVAPERGFGYGGRGHTFDGHTRMTEVPVAQVRDLDLDLILFQAPHHFQVDQFEILSATQQRLPKIYLEHNTPKPHPTDSQHPVDDPNILLVHVTHYNQLMWDNGRCPTVVIEHAVAIDPTVVYQGQLDRGISVQNCPTRRPRIAGWDLFQRARERVPLDVVGLETEMVGGLGDIAYRDLHRRVAEYRFLFSPMRYTSLPLAVIEGLTIGMPIVALATTELPTVIQNGVTGYLSCDLEVLIDGMRYLLDNPAEARRMGDNARVLAQDRFSLARFKRDWDAAFSLVTGERRLESGVAWPSLTF
jgi:hypothetical protein